MEQVFASTCPNSQLLAAVTLERTTDRFPASYSPGCAASMPAHLYLRLQGIAYREAGGPNGSQGHQGQKSRDYAGRVLHLYAVLRAMLALPG
jgi:hypothetical protein